MTKYYKIPNSLMTYKVNNGILYFYMEWVDLPKWISIKYHYLSALEERGAKDVTRMLLSKWGKIKYSKLLGAKDQ